jgi:hypothetical protein
VQGIARVGLLLTHHRRTDLCRVSYPKFVVIGQESFLEPLRVDCGLHPNTSWTGKCGVKPLRPVTADEQKFLINSNVAQSSQPITLYANWTAGLKK